MHRSFTLRILLFLSSISMAYSQSKADYVWIFGSNALSLEGSEGSLVSFNGDGRDTSYVQLSESIGSNNASICDVNGKLLFYTNGCAVFDSTFQVMVNGDGINPGDRHDVHCPFGNYIGLQNSLIINIPNTANDFYYIHKTVTLSDDFELSTSGILKTIISFDVNPLGEVIIKNEIIDVNRKSLTGYLEAIKHKNGEDWWIIDFTEGPEEHFYLAYLIDSDTLSLQHELEIENIASLTDRCASTSQSCFSPDGTKLAKMCAESGFDLWDFDRSSGLISNYRHLPIETNYVNCGVGISPNSRFAYLSCSDSLWQVDLWEEDLSVGLELIDTLDKTADPFTVTNFGYQQLGPDCKIYMNTVRQYDWLHVINNPDEKGKACDFRQHSIKLPHLNQPGSFPNFPHFRIDEDDVCDPTITSVFGVPIETVSGMVVFPNPTTGEVTVELPETVSGRMSVKDLTSQVVLTLNWDHADKRQVDFSGCDAGMYLLELYSDYARRWVGRVVVID